MSSNFRPSVCPHDCPSVCSLNIEITADSRIGRLRGAAHPCTGGVICAKVARYAERANHSQRLTQPLRQGEGRPTVSASTRWSAPNRAGRRPAWPVTTLAVWIERES